VADDNKTRRFVPREKRTKVNKLVLRPGDQDDGSEQLDAPRGSRDSVSGGNDDDSKNSG